MTTIAWDGKTVAYDSQSTAGAFVLSNQQKMFEVNTDHTVPAISWQRPVGVICSGAKGDHRHALHFLRNCTEEGVLEMQPELSFCAWVFTAEGRCWAIQKQEGDVLPSLYEVLPPAAEGSGHDIAMTAMYLGKDAREAVMVAGVLDCYTDTNVQSHEFYFNNGVMK